MWNPFQRKPRFTDWSFSNDILVAGGFYQAPQNVTATPNDIPAGQSVLFVGTEHVQTDKSEFDSSHVFEYKNQLTTLRSADDLKSFVWSEPAFLQSWPSNMRKRAQQLVARSPSERIEAALDLIPHASPDLLEIIWPIASLDATTVLEGDVPIPVRKIIQDELVTLGEPLLAFLALQRAAGRLMNPRLARDLSLRCGSDIFWDDILADAASAAPVARTLAIVDMAQFNRPDVRIRLEALLNDPNSDVRKEAATRLKEWCLRFDTK